MYTVTLSYTKAPAEVFFGIVAHNVGQNMLQVTDWNGRATIIVFDTDTLERVTYDPITDDNLSEQPEEFQAWYNKQQTLAEERAKDLTLGEAAPTLQ